MFYYFNEKTYSLSTLGIYESLHCKLLIKVCRMEFLRLLQPPATLDEIEEAVNELDPTSEDYQEQKEYYSKLAKRVALFSCNAQLLISMRIICVLLKLKINPLYPGIATYLLIVFLTILIYHHNLSRGRRKQ